MVLPFYKKTFKGFHSYPLKAQDIFEIPMCSGVYFLTEIFMGEEVIVYIGSSRCLRQRLYSHPITLKLKKKKVFGGMYVIAYGESEDYKYMEKSFIFKIKPLYNVAGLNNDPYIEFSKKEKNERN